MTQGFFLFFDEPQRADYIRDHIQENKPFSDALSLSDIGLHHRAIALISFDTTHLDFAALAVRGRQVVTGKAHVRFSNYIDLGNLPIDAVERRISSKLTQHLLRAFSGHGGAIPPETWKQVFAVTKDLRPSLATDLDYLDSLVGSTSDRWATPHAKALAEEKDAVQLARKAFGIDLHREPLLWRASEPEEVASFLQGIDNVVAREDTLINHDANIFGAWEIVRRHQVGAVEFTHNKQRLTILTAHRTPLEESLGVDLVYYNHQYDSFILVQYKRMRSEGRRLVYRPGGDDYEKELGMMRRLQKSLPRPCDPPLHKEFRLSWHPFFFKLCSTPTFEPTKQELTPGMYFPLDFWETLMSSDAITGPRGGKAVDYDNAGRWINNTLFISLLQEGWIGSAAGCSQALSKVVRESLQNKRSLVFAATGRKF